MLTITQMRQLTGVSRRTLQDYDELKLLTHRDTTPGGYWLYDEEDVERLSVIQMLHHIGYTRKEIGEVIDDPSISLEQLLDRAQTSLEERRSHISGLLRYIDFIRLQQALPPIAIHTANRIHSSVPGQKMPLMEALDTTTRLLGSMEASEELEAFMPLLMHMACLQLLSSEPVDSPAVQACVQSMLRLSPDQEPWATEKTAAFVLELAETIPEDEPSAAASCAFVREAVLSCMENLPGDNAAGEAED